MAMSDKDRADAEAAARRMASAVGSCNGLPTPMAEPSKRPVGIFAIVFLMLIVVATQAARVFLPQLKSVPEYVDCF
jgi:hypothetical protein